MDIRTDLAVEAKESFEGDGGEIEGVTLKKKKVGLENGSFEVSRVCVLNEEGSRAMGKPIGNYISIDTPDIDRLSENDYERLANEVAHIIKKLVNCHCNLNKTYFRVFVAGLGNRCITADSLGPYVIDNVFITRHFVKEFGGSFLAKLNACEVCGIAPGVMAQTGMEALEIVKSIAGKVKPDVIVVIDALAARSIHRINRTIQITDTGINPGSGVGNHRMGLSEKELGMMAAEKRLITPTRDYSLDEVYSSLADFPEERRINFRDTEILDTAVKQFREAAYGVVNGTMTVEEAVANYGMIPTK